MDDYSYSKKLISDFNQAGLQIIRLDSLWNKCNNLAPKGMLKEWNWQLDRVKQELSSDMADVDGEENSKKPNSYYMKIKEINAKIQQECNNKEELYRYLMEKERILRRLEDKAGKGSKKRYEDEDLID